ncbi:hypothetical protein [Streptomyces litchfieldiae]|uniref:Secreted protein n=1 Tax=Streptomyces litchfieldiae TaxID=3075543 RepID=A0ABU2MPD4_9ACTN|nr:hypothetical protein [Streptomyces sp. DSM 44938]MDT0343492.1 hypothetical protein [Streptomyces sp. DSM 44938]
MRWLTKAMTTALAGGLAALTFVTTAADASPGADVAAAADEAPGYAVEDFNYPRADEILAERGILLKRGDGHIVLTDCGPTGLLEVWARDQSDRICFRVTGTEGYLSLELPAVYAIKGAADTTTTANMTVEDEEKSFTVPADEWTPVGEPTDEPEHRDHLLVELITTSSQEGLSS